MNTITIIGRLVRDPELKQTNNTDILNVTLAVDRDFRNSEGEYEVDFINCVLWKGIASNTAKYCKKGDMVAITGRLQIRKYEYEGVTRITAEVVAEKVKFLKTKREEV